MTYFKAKSPMSLGVGFDKSRFMVVSQASKDRASGKVAGAEAIAMDKVRAGWPRCSYTQVDHRTTPTSTTTKSGGYLYKFKSGTSPSRIGLQIAIDN